MDRSNIMVKSPEVINDNGYAYSLWSGRLIVLEGRIIKISRDRIFCQGKTKSIGCSLEPGVVYNAVIWLPERNDDLAKSILIEYEQMQIAKLQEKIDNHLNKIKILKD